MKHYKICLSVAGSDPSGGAGLQADLKTFAALGCYGAAVVTSLTAQNTCGVSGTLPVPPDFVKAQMEAVLDDLDVRAIKIGMAANAGIVRAISSVIRDRRPPFVVLDPVMISTSGHSLLEPAAVESLVNELMPLCQLVTPNQHEFRALTNTDDAVEGGRRLIASSGCPYVLVKGGDKAGEANDILVSATDVWELRGERIDTVNTHGTGCTLSSAIAAHIAQGFDVPEAVRRAKNYISEALKCGADVQIGHGHGPVNHFYSPHAAIIEEK